MKTIRNVLTALIAAGAPGVALLAATNLVPADTAIAALSVGGLLAFAIFDYSRRVNSLQVKAAILRPTLPVRAAARPAALHRAA